MLALGLSALTVRAEIPGYLRTALANFNPVMPVGWACTITTTRNNEQLVERFDPSRPPAEEWSILETNGRAPTPKEIEKYRQSRPPGTQVGPQTNFKKNDIEPGTITLLSENDQTAEFSAAFRTESAGADKMLGHLVLRLTVNKLHPHIARCTLSLTEPYSPVLGVKMNELLVETAFTAPEADRPSLPISHTSRFAGRILLIPTEENLTVSYRDCAAVP